MGLYLEKALAENGQVSIWKIEESEQFFKERLPLSSTEAETLKKKHPSHQLEWLASRYLLHLMTDGATSYTDECGKPHLHNRMEYISLSHSREFVAVIVHPKVVGIDIQKITPKIERIARKFMRDEEEESLAEGTKLAHLHVFWGAKEALYKAYGKQKLEFREHILVTPFNYDLPKGIAEGQVVKEDYAETFDLYYEKFLDYILVYAVQKG